MSLVKKYETPNGPKKNPMRMGWLLLWGLLACSPSALQVQAHLVNDQALAANEVLPVLLEAYRQEGIAAIRQAPSLNDAQQALEGVRHRWAPVWGVCGDTQAGPTHHCHDGAWPLLADAQNAWASVLEHEIKGTPIDAATVTSVARAMKSAYCMLETVLPSGTRIPEALHAGCQK